MKRCLLTFCLGFLVPFTFAAPVSADFSLLLSEEWLDDAIGATPNNMPEIGQASYAFGTHTVYDQGGGDKGVEMQSGFTGGYVQYTALQSRSDLQNVNYRFGVDSSVSGPPSSDQLSQAVSLNNENVALYWGLDNTLKYLSTSSNTGVVDTGITYQRNQIYNVEFLFDYRNDSVEILLDGQAIMSEALASSESSINQILFSMSPGMAGKSRLEHISVGASSVPEPSSIALCSCLLLGLMTRRQRR